MFNTLRTFPGGLSARRAEAADQDFLGSLRHHSTSSPTLLRAAARQVEDLTHQHLLERQQGRATSAPEVMELVLEKSSQPVGRLLLAWTGTEAIVLDLAFLADLSGLDLEIGVLNALQSAAQAGPLRLAVVVPDGESEAAAPLITTLRLLGFVEDPGPSPVRRMVWHGGLTPIPS